MKIYIGISLVVIWAGISSGAPQTGQTGVDACFSVLQCPKYHRCVASIFFDNHCADNFKKLNPSDNPEINNQEGGCKFVDSNGRELPNQNACTALNPISLNRCFPQHGFTCSKAYYMPCTPTYDIDQDGSAQLIQEKGCPNSFTCQEVTFQNNQKGEACVPNSLAPDDGSSGIVPCQNDSECGYSELTNNWAVCFEGHCRNAIQ